MYEQVDNQQENASPSGRIESRAVVNFIIHEKSDEEQVLDFQDNRTTAVSQRKFQKMVGSYSTGQQNPIQKIENSKCLHDNLITGIVTHSGDPVSQQRQNQITISSPVQRVIIVKSDKENEKSDLEKYCNGKEKLKSATAGACGEVYLSLATEALAEDVLADEKAYVGKNDKVVVKQVIVHSMKGIRTEDNIPLEGLLPDKLNANSDFETVATNTFAMIQVMKGEKILSYYLIMEYAKGGDQAHKNVKKSEITDFNKHAKAYYIRLDLILSHLEKSGYTSGDIKPANIFIDSEGLPMLGDFGDYSKGNYTRRAQDVVDLMNNLMKASGHKKTLTEIKAWANDDSLWVPSFTL